MIVEDNEFLAPQDLANRGGTAQARRGCLTTHAYHWHLLGLDSDSSTSSLMVHIYIKK